MIMCRWLNEVIISRMLPCLSFGHPPTAGHSLYLGYVTVYLPRIIHGERIKQGDRDRKKTSHKRKRFKRKKEAALSQNVGKWRKILAISCRKTIFLN